jgi:hypothetical protein
MSDKRGHVFDSVAQFCVFHGIIMGCIAGGMIGLAVFGLLAGALIEGARAVLRRFRGGWSGAVL